MADNSDETPTTTVSPKLDLKKSASVTIAPTVPTTQAQVVEIFATSYFTALGLSVCSKCGGKKQTDSDGKVVCSIGDTNCPMVKGGE